MGFDPHTLPDSLKSKMAVEAKTELGFVALTTAEAQAKYERREEKKLHEQFEQWCNMIGLRNRIHCRMDKPTTIEKGWPDFTLIKQGRVCCIEFKAPGGKLSPDQFAVGKRITDDGTLVRVCYDLAEAILFAKEFFGL